MQAARGWRVMVSPWLLPDTLPSLHFTPVPVWVLHGPQFLSGHTKNFPAAAWGPHGAPALLCSSPQAAASSLLLLGVCRAASSPFSPHPHCLADILPLFKPHLSPRHSQCNSQAQQCPALRSCTGCARCWGSSGLSPQRLPHPPQS